jgi:hypothetical protein
MVRVVVPALAVLAFLGAPQVRAENEYTLTIDGQPQDLTLGQDKVVTLPDGKIITLKVERKETSVFSANGASFEHPSSIAVNSSAPDDGMTQHIGASGLGTLMLVQVNDNIDLPSLLDTVYNKMVEEPKAMGISIEKSDVKRTLKDGTVISGVKAHYMAKDDDVTIELFTHQGKAASYLAMSMHDMATAPHEKVVIDRFWQTLRLD